MDKNRLTLGSQINRWILANYREKFCAPSAAMPKFANRAADAANRVACCRRHANRKIPHATNESLKEAREKWSKGEQNAQCT